METEKALPISGLALVFKESQMRNRHSDQWRFLLFTLIVTVQRRTWKVNVIGICLTPSQGCGQPPVRMYSALPRQNGRAPLRFRRKPKTAHPLPRSSSFAAQLLRWAAPRIWSTKRFYFTGYAMICQSRVTSQRSPAKRVRRKKEERGNEMQRERLLAP